MPGMKIHHRVIDKDSPVYIIAEMSANHNGDLNKAIRIIEAAKEAGADAVKLQTYTADTMTIDCRSKYFLLETTIWKGKNLYDLYSQAATPWRWFGDLKSAADKIEIDLFSTPFDDTAVDFLENMAVPAYKIASFEIVDIPLLKKVGATNKPVVLSTGMASIAEIEEAVTTLRKAGTTQIALLKCTSAYPAPPEEANLKTIPHLAQTFDVPVGLSDHTLGSAVALGAVALGASLVEKHFTLSRNDSGPDSSFSMEPEEFKKMVEDIRILEKSLGRICYDVTEKQQDSLMLRRSLFAVEDIAEGEKFSRHNIRSVRPGHGLHPRYFEDILKKKATRKIEKGMPLQWGMIG